MLVSILMLLSFVLFVLSLLKAATSFTRMIWLPFALFAAISTMLCVYGLVSLIGVPFSPILTVAINFIAAVSIWLYAKRSKPEAGHPRWATRKDVILLAFILLFSACVFAIQFGYPIMPNFETTDPAIHLSSSIRMYEGGTITGQYSTHMICACFITILSPFLGPDCMLLAFALSETFLLFLSGLMFYSVIAVYCQKLGWIAGIVLCGFYLLGYPLNNSIFGFSYWGFSVTIICALIFAARVFPIQRLVTQVLFAICLFDLMISYSLFVPVTYIAVFAWMIAKLRKDGIALVLRALSIVFVFPVIIGFLVVYLGIFGNSGASGVSSAINTAGYSFKNLFALFIPIAPLSIYGAVINRRQNSFLVLFSALFVLFSIALCVLGMLNYVSAYYFSKVYSVIWLILFVFGALGVQSLKEQNLAMLVSYSAVWLLVLFLAVSGMDNKIYDSRREFSSAPVAWSLYPLYEFNLARLPHDEGDEGLVELFQQARSYGDAGADYEVIGSDYMIRWSTPILDNDDPLLWWTYDEQSVLDDLSSHDYIVMGHGAPESLVTVDGKGYEEIRAKALGQYEEVFRNDAGGIYKRRTVQE